MQTLADMGRLFNDEDEAKMVKLTEDLTAWINKYAPSMDDPESLLLEVASSFITDDMEDEMPEEDVIEAPQSTITISFSFGDNAEWFSFE